MTLLIMDNTYKVNRFNMPLLQIIGTTGLHKSFSTKARSMDPLTADIPDPGVVITDFDTALKNALDSIFPSTQQQNVILHIKKKWEGSLDGTEIGGDRPEQETRLAAAAALDDPIQADNAIDEDRPIDRATDYQIQHASQLADQCVEQQDDREDDDGNPILPPAPRRTFEHTADVFRARTAEECRDQWDLLCIEFSDQPVFHLRYPTLKSRLRNRFIDLHQLQEHIRGSLPIGKRSIARSFNPTDDYEVTAPKNWLAADETDLQASMPTICTGAFTMQWGLPCRHTIRDLIQADAAALIPLHLIDNHWRVYGVTTTKPILTLSSLAGVETVDARYPPLEASTGRILSAREQEEHRANPELKKRKGTGTTIMNKRSNTLASVSSRVDDLAQQIGDFIKSQAAATPVLLSQVPSLPQVPLVSQGYQTTMPSLPQPAPPSQGYYVMPPPTPIVPVYVQAPAPSQWQEPPPPAGTVSRDGYGAFPAARGSEDTAPYKTSRQAGHKFVPRASPSAASDGSFLTVGKDLPPLYAYWMHLPALVIIADRIHICQTIVG
ncbi:MULE transposase [Hirsutella rhossiliensis]